MVNFLKFFTYCFLCLISLASYAQQNGIKKIDAFYAQRIPGNIPVDDNGNSLYKGPDTLTTIYIETTGEEPRWNTAWKGNKVYSVTNTLIRQTRFDAGIKKSNNQKIILSPAKGNRLWQLELMMQEHKEAPPQNIKTGEIILRGKYKKKTFFQKISRQTELKLPDSV